MIKEWNNVERNCGSFETLVSCYAYVGLTTYAPFDNKCLSSFWVTFKSSHRLGEKRVMFLNSGQNSSIFESLWLLLSILSFQNCQNVISWAWNWFYLILLSLALAYTYTQALHWGIILGTLTLVNALNRRSDASSVSLCGGKMQIPT